MNSYLITNLHLGEEIFKCPEHLLSFCMIVVETVSIQALTVPDVITAQQCSLVSEGTC